MDWRVVSAKPGLGANGARRRDDVEVNVVEDRLRRQCPPAAVRCHRSKVRSCNEQVAHASVVDADASKSVPADDRATSYGIEQCNSRIRRDVPRDRAGGVRGGDLPQRFDGDLPAVARRKTAHDDTHETVIARCADFPLHAQSTADDCASGIRDGWCTGLVCRLPLDVKRRTHFVATHGRLP